MHDDAALPLLYTDLAGWFHLLTAPHEYEEEAAVYRAALLAHAPRTRTLLELGSGGGNNAWWLKRDFACTLSDLSQPMLDLSLRVNPDCEHVQGDMRTLRLGRTFDAVLVHDAVMYMLTEEDLRRAIDTAYVHCNTGGVALFVPDFVRETFAPGTECGGNDGDDGRGLRYLEWCWDRTRATRRTSRTTRASCARPTATCARCTIDTSRASSRGPRGCACSRAQALPPPRPGTGCRTTSA